MIKETLDGIKNAIFNAFPAATVTAKKNEDPDEGQGPTYVIETKPDSTIYVLTWYRRFKHIPAKDRIDIRVEYHIHSYFCNEIVKRKIYNGSAVVTNEGDFDVDFFVKLFKNIENIGV